MNFLKSISNVVQSGFNILSADSLITRYSGGCSSLLSRCVVTLAKLHQQGPPKRVKKPHKILEGNPFLKGVILRTVIKKPRKPNSANRKCVFVRLSNGKETFAYVPRIGHNLQEHQFVLVRGGRLKDVPGVKVRCVRGAYDLPHPEKPSR